MREIPATGRFFATLGISLALLALPAHASDEDAFKDLKARYEKLAKKNDDVGQRARRPLLREMAAFADLKACRKLLRDAWDEEKASLANRCEVVRSLAASGDTKELDFLLKSVAKETGKRDGPRSPAIALGTGLAMVPEGSEAAIALHALKAAAKARDDLRISLVEGVGRLAPAEALQPLLALDVGSDLRLRYERAVAVGSCGGEAALAFLRKEIADPSPDARLGAATGLGYCETAGANELLVNLLGDRDPRVIESAARSLGRLQEASAAKSLVAAFRGSPLRTREVVRTALRDITGNDYGHDADAWEKNLGAKPGTQKAPLPAPRLPTLFGTAVPTDNVVIVLDTSRSMEWLGRRERARSGLVDFLGTLADEAVITLYTTGITPSSFRDGASATAGTARDAARKWIEEQLGGRGFDVLQVLAKVLRDHPQADSVVLATDSPPWATRPNADPRETLEVFQRDNALSRVAVHVAFVAPGGRYEQGGENDEDEWNETIEQLQRLAEESRGTFTHVK